MTVHHAGDQSAATGPERYRAWQAFRIGRGWGDLAYHCIIGVGGTVYEARDSRYAGATRTSYDPTSHLLIVVEATSTTVTQHPPNSKRWSTRLRGRPSRSTCHPQRSAGTGTMQPPHALVTTCTHTSHRATLRETSKRSLPRDDRVEHGRYGYHEASSYERHGQDLSSPI